MWHVIFDARVIGLRLLIYLTASWGNSRAMKYFRFGFRKMFPNVSGLKYSICLQHFKTATIFTASDSCREMLCPCLMDSKAFPPTPTPNCIWSAVQIGKILGFWFFFSPPNPPCWMRLGKLAGMKLLSVHWTWNAGFDQYYLFPFSYFSKTKSESLQL